MVSSREERPGNVRRGKVPRGSTQSVTGGVAGLVQGVEVVHLLTLENTQQEVQLMLEELIPQRPSVSHNGFPKVITHLFPQLCSIHTSEACSYSVLEQHLCTLIDRLRKVCKKPHFFHSLIKLQQLLGSYFLPRLLKGFKLVKVLNIFHFIKLF